MQNCRILYTDMESGMNNLPIKCPYLTEAFFIDNPVQKPDEPEEDEQELSEEETLTNANNDLDDEFKSASAVA